MAIAGKTRRAYLSYYSVAALDPIKLSIYDFADSRAGSHAQAFPGGWCGSRDTFAVGLLGAGLVSGICWGTGQNCGHKLSRKSVPWEMYNCVFRLSG